MKKIFALAVILLFTFSVLLQAASYYDKAVNKDEGNIGYTRYYGTVTFADSASGTNYYTQAFKIAGINYVDALAHFQCSEVGTEDVNVFIEYSDDLINWTAGTTDSDLDALGTTIVYDTLGIVQNAEQGAFHGYKWARFKFTAGGSINSTTVTWSAIFVKPAGIKGRFGDVTNKR